MLPLALPLLMQKQLVMGSAKLALTGPAHKDMLGTHPYQRA